MAFGKTDAFAETLEKLVPSHPVLKDNWDEIRSLFHIRPNLINLHNGVSPTLKSVLVKMNELDKKVLAYPMDGAGMAWEEIIKTKEAAAKVAKVKTENIAITSSTTEGANIVINGIDLSPGDEILYTYHEYPSIVEALQLKEKRSGIKITKLDIPLNGDEGSALEIIRKNITSKTKLLVISHVSCRNGEIFPIKEIADLVHQYGIEILVDGAHALGHIDVDLMDLGADYYTTCLHKWLAGPMGGGILFIRPEKVAKILPLFGTGLDPRSSDMQKFENFYGYGFAAKAGSLLAMNLHEEIGQERKTERLTALRKYWMDRLDNPKVTITTPYENHRAAGMGSFRVNGVDAYETAKKLKAEKSLAVGCNGPLHFSQFRVTPHIYTRTEELDVLIEYINKL